jgi:signal transduction histidine kinase
MTTAERAGAPLSFFFSGSVLSMTSDLEHHAEVPSPADIPITARTLRRERTRMSQHIASALAHELRSPVLGIASAVQLLRYRNSDDPLIERNLGRVLRETERLNAIITALLDYGQPAPLQPAPDDPSTLWPEVVESRRGMLESKAILVRHNDSVAKTICAIDRDQLVEALGNVLANAIEAAPEGSDLVIESAVAPNGDWRSWLHNDGPPIAAEVLPHAFEPLVTNKTGHIGTGLAVAHRIVSDHGGTIALENSPAGGVTVTITLPHARFE